MLKYSSSTLIKKESCRSLNVGYLFLKDIYYDLKIHIVSQREIKKILTATRKEILLLEFKKKTRAHKWRNYAVYGLLTLYTNNTRNISFCP